MKVESPSPSYWRANALETFTGNAWTAAQAFLDGLEQTQSDSTYVYSLRSAETPTPPGVKVTQTFQVQSVYSNYFFVGGDPLSLAIDQDLVLRTNDTRAIHSNRAVGPTFAYTVTAVIPDLEPTDVVGKGRDYPESARDYLGLPFPRVEQIEGPDKEATWRSTVPDNTPEGREWVDLYALNRQIVGDATDPYEVTLRIERYLRDPRYFEYSLTPPASDYSSSYSAFLFDTRSGYCQHFAGAMALLLRYNGIPARVAVGFTGGEEGDRNTYIVSTNNAHAWVEVYFPEVGWVAFDPTPGRNLPTATSSSNPRFINPFVEEGSAGQGPVTTMPPRENIPEDRPSGGAAADAEGRGWLASAPWVPWVAGLVVLLIAWPVGRSLWRKRRLERGPLDQRLQASLALLRERDGRLRYGRGPIVHARRDTGDPRDQARHRTRPRSYRPHRRHTVRGISRHPGGCRPGRDGAQGCSRPTAQAPRVGADRGDVVRCAAIGLPERAGSVNEIPTFSPRHTPSG